jgi:hypothetical protein
MIEERYNRHPLLVGIHHFFPEQKVFRFVQINCNIVAGSFNFVAEFG